MFDETNTYEHLGILQIRVNFCTIQYESRSRLKFNIEYVSDKNQFLFSETDWNTVIVWDMRPLSSGNKLDFTSVNEIVSILRLRSAV